MALQDVAREAGIPIQAVLVTAKWESCLRPIGGGLYAPYPCPARVPTIGYGTTRYNEINKPVTLADKPITKQRAEELLAYDLGRVYSPAVRRAAKFKSENQYAACISFAYNVGTGGFKKSTLCWLINQGRYADAQREFAKWTRGGGRVLPGLVNRRRDEAQLFGTPGAPYAEPSAAKPQPMPEIAPTPTKRISWWNRFAFWK